MEEFTVTFIDLTDEFTIGVTNKITEAPEDGNQYARQDAGWSVLAGGGDMLKSVYDPTNKNADAFDYDNLDNTPTTITTQQATDISTNNSKVSDVNHVTAELPNVDNTSDANKPVSTAQQTALNLKADKSNVLELDNTDVFTPTADYHPSTKKYVDDNAGGGGGGKFVDGTDPLDAVYTDGNVGVGTVVPISKLEVKGDMPTLSISDNRDLASWTAGQEICALDFVSNDSGLSGGAFARIIGTNRILSSSTVPVGALSFQAGFQGVGLAEQMRVESTGVEINTLKLATKLTIDSGADAEIILDAAANTRFSIISFTRSGVATPQGRIKMDFDSQDNVIKMGFHAGNADLERMMIRGDGKVAINGTTPQAQLDVNGGVKIGDDTDVASVDKAGTTRYRVDANNSYLETCMQTGASTWAWEITKQNTW